MGLFSGEQIRLKELNRIIEKRTDQIKRMKQDY